MLEELEPRLHLAADLIGNAFNSDEPLTWGQAFNVDGQITNQGGSWAGASTVKFYLSSNDIISTADHYLGALTIPSVGAGWTYSFNDLSVNLPAAPPAGFTATDDVYIGIIVDADNNLLESNETNNSNRGLGLDRDLVHITTPVVQQPDLLGTLVDADEPLVWGQKFYTDASIKNQGQLAAGALTVKFYLSTDATITDGDYYLGALAIQAGIGAGQTFSVSNLSMTLPGAPPAEFTATDDVYIGMIVDTGHGVTESNEANNSNVGEGLDMDLVHVTAPLRPDLIGTVFDSDEPLIWSRYFNVGGSIKNQGQAAAGASTAKFYLSTDATITTGDYYLGASAVSAIAAGGTFTFNNKQLKLPNTPPAGFTATDNVYIGMIVDATNVVVESNETNNRNRGVGLDKDLVRVTAPAPDLIGILLDSNEPLVWGQNFNIGGKIKNQGLAAAGASTVKFYLSSDATIDAADHYLGFRVIPNIGAGATFTFSNQLLALPLAPPVGFPAAGTVYVGMIVDANGNVAETIETNNSNRGTGLDRDAVAVS